MKFQILITILAVSFLGSSVVQAQVSRSIGDQTKRGLVKRDFQRENPPQQNNNLHEVLEDLSRLQEAAEDRDFDFVVQFSRDIESDLNQFGYDRKLNEAKDALRYIRLKAQERRTTSYEKMNVIREEISNAKEAIRCSETFRRREAPRRPQPPIRPRGPETIFGATEHFSKSKIETRSIAVNFKGDVVALRLKALDDIMSIQSITLILHDGRQVTMSGMVIYENDSSIVTLEGCYRIREIQVRGSSGNIFGTKAKVQVSGF